MQDTTRSPGQLLQQKREEKNLSVDEVAQSMNLTTRTINAIEADDYDSLPGATYTRGYLRNYAQLLNISAEPLIDLFNEQVAAEEKKKEIPINTPATAKETKSSDKGVMLGTALVAIVIFGLAVSWWQGREGGKESAKPVQMSQNTTDATGGDTATTSTAAATGDGVGSDSSIGTTIKDSDTHAVQKDTTQDNTATSQDQQPKNTAGSDTTKTVATDAGAGKDIAVVLDKAQSRIVLHAKQSSWADIRDARNNKLLYETVAAGRIVTIKGVGPFNIFLGNASGIKMQFNGKDYDLEQHRNGLVARFKLGNEPAQ